MGKATYAAPEEVRRKLLLAMGSADAPSAAFDFLTAGRTDRADSDRPSRDTTVAPK